MQRKEEILNKRGTAGDFRTGERHLLIAVDGSENAGRAVLYVAGLLGGLNGFKATLLNIIPELSEDFISTDSERDGWLAENRAKSLRFVEENRKILVQSGFREDMVDFRVEVKSCPSVADCIMAEREILGCGTIVLGRRGISRREEFIFGSTSSKILHSARNCAVWVIE